MQLEKEIETFEKALPELLQTVRGQYALIHEETVDSTWQTEDKAYIQGCKRFGVEPFLVMLIESTESPVSVLQAVNRVSPSSPAH